MIDLKNAFKAAKNAFPKWSETTLEKRSQILSNIAHLITKKLPELALQLKLKIMESH